jgi:predicted MFS family arabinose efflux permease
MPPTQYRSRMLTLLAVVYALLFADRIFVPLLIEDIKRDMQLTDTQVGFLTGMAFALFYSTLGIPIARWADRGNRITIISLATALWSAMMMCGGLAATYVQLLLARIGAAVGEAGCVPPAQSLIADYYERKERARAMSLYMVGGQAAILLGSVAVGWLNQRYGWRVAFWVLGAPGVLLALLVRFGLHEPRLRAAAPQQSAGEPAGYLAEFKILWRQRAYRHLTTGITIVTLFGFGIGQWMPPFLIRTYDVDTAQLGWWYALIWGVGGMVGTYAGGHLVSRYIADDEPLQLKAMAVLMVGFIPLYLGVYLIHSIPVVLSLMVVGALFYTATTAPGFALIQQVVPAHMRAMAIAVMLLLSNLIGMGLGPVAVGVLSDYLAPRLGEGSLRMALVIWTPGYLWAAFHLLRARRYVRGDIESSRAQEQAAALQTAKECEISAPMAAHVKD